MDFNKLDLSKYANMKINFPSLDLTGLAEQLPIDLPEDPLKEYREALNKTAENTEVMKNDLSGLRGELNDEIDKRKKGDIINFIFLIVNLLIALASLIISILK